MKILGFAALNRVLLILTGYADGFYGEPDILACPKEQSQKVETPGAGMLWYKFACSRRRG